MELTYFDLEDKINELENELVEKNKFIGILIDRLPETEYSIKRNKTRLLRTKIYRFKELRS